MATYRLSRFSKPSVLKKVDTQVLVRFLSPHREHLRARGVALGSEEDLDYDALLDVFMNPESDYPELAEQLYIVDELATNDGMVALLEAAQEKGLDVQLASDPTPAEIVIRLWLLDSQLVERKHAESFLTRVRSFEYSQPSAPPPPFQTPTATRLGELARDLDDWFESKRRGRGSKVFSFTKSDGVWFLVRHGEPLRREGTMGDGKQGTVVYRPEKYNVLVLDPRTAQLGINAPSKGEKDLYRKKFGLHLYGQEGFFSAPGRYTLEPLRRDGEASLVCSDIDGLEWAKLREVKFFWGGASKEVEIRQATDIFAVYGSNGRSMPRTALQQAKFEVKFSNAKASRRLTIRPPSTAQYTRDGDKVILEAWMARRGFLQDGVGEVDG